MLFRSRGRWGNLGHRRSRNGNLSGGRRRRTNQGRGRRRHRIRHRIGQRNRSGRRPSSGQRDLGHPAEWAGRHRVRRGRRGVLEEGSGNGRRRLERGRRPNRGDARGRLHRVGGLRILVGGRARERGLRTLRRGGYRERQRGAHRRRLPRIFEFGMRLLGYRQRERRERRRVGRRCRGLQRLAFRLVGRLLRRRFRSGVWLAHRSLSFTVHTPARAGARTSRTRSTQGFDMPQPNP